MSMDEIFTEIVEDAVAPVIARLDNLESLIKTGEAQDVASDTEIKELMKQLVEKEEEIESKDQSNSTPDIIVPGSGFKNNAKNTFTDAHDLVIDGYRYQGDKKKGENALTFKGECKNITIKNSNVSDCSKAIYVDRYKKGKIDKLSILSSTGSNLSKSFLDISLGSKLINIDGFSYDGKYNDKENFSMALIFRDCYDVLVDSFNIRNIVYYQMSKKKVSYPNADGIAVEGGDRYMFKNGSMSNITDGGIDSKVAFACKSVTFTGVKRPIRVWDRKKSTILKDVKIVDAKSDKIYEWFKKVYPNSPIGSITGGTPLWSRHPECEINGIKAKDIKDGLDGVEIINGSKSCRIN